MQRSVRIGTRKSRLALYQAEQVAGRLRAAFPDQRFELCPMSTIGDRVQDRLLSEVGGKGLFAKELEEQLLAGRVDLVVHSLKDLETSQPEGLQLTGVLSRDDPRDVLLSLPGYDLHSLPEAPLFGTASVRRAAQLRRYRPHLRTAPLRGNVETRIRKLGEGAADFTLLAKCGLDRLGIVPPGNVVLAISDSLPAVGQGFIAVQSRCADREMNARLTAVCDATGLLIAQAERALQHHIDGSCHTAMAAYAERQADGLMAMQAELYIENQRFFAEGRAAALDQSGAEALGVDLAEALLHQADQLFGDARARLNAA